MERWRFLTPQLHKRGQAATQKPAASYRSLPGQAATRETSFPSGILRGQAATEFLLYTAVFMLIAIGAFVIVTDLQASEVPLQQNTVAKETGDGFVTALTLAVKGGTGFSYNYSFPKTIFARPYVIDMSRLNADNSTIMMDYIGDYANFSYQYGVPKYSYKVGGGCIAGSVLESTQCSNVIMLNNDGENLTITQLP
jgi:hypothetical protein